MAAGEVLIGIGGIIGALGTCISAIALLRNDDADDDIDRQINRQMKLKILRDMQEDDADDHGRLDIIFTPVRLLRQQWALRWSPWP